MWSLGLGVLCFRPKEYQAFSHARDVSRAVLFKELYLGVCLARSIGIEYPGMWLVVAWRSWGDMSCGR